MPSGIHTVDSLQIYFQTGVNIKEYNAVYVLYY